MPSRAQSDSNSPMKRTREIGRRRLIGEGIRGLLPRALGCIVLPNKTFQTSYLKYFYSEGLAAIKIGIWDVLPVGFAL